METIQLPSIPANSNPFDYDLYNMGTRVASNCIIMHSTHSTQDAASVIVINTVTGERTKVVL